MVTLGHRRNPARRRADEQGPRSPGSAVAYINIFRGMPGSRQRDLGLLRLVARARHQLHRLPGGCDRARGPVQRLHRRDLPLRARGDPTRPARGGARARHDAPCGCSCRIVLPQATKIAIPNIGSMFIGMVKDTSVFTVIGLRRGRSRDPEHQLDHVPAVRALHGGGLSLRDRCLRASTSCSGRSRSRSRHRRRDGSPTWCTAGGVGASSRLSATTRPRREGRNQVSVRTSHEATTNNTDLRRPMALGPQRKGG